MKRITASICRAILRGREKEYREKRTGRWLMVMRGTEYIQRREPGSVLMLACFIERERGRSYSTEVYGKA